MRRIVGGVILKTISATSVMQPAWAGAWVHEKSSGYSSLTVQRDEGEFGGAWRSDSYIERGVTDQITVVLKAETLWRDIDAGEDRVDGIGAVRRQIWRRGGMVASGQLGVLLGESLEGPICEGTGTETRGLFGWSGRHGDRSIWINAEAALRNRGGCDRWKVDLAAGYIINEDWRIETKAYSQHGDGPRSLKLEAGIQYDLGDDFLGVAYRREVGKAFEEDSWIVSLSRKF